MKCQECGQKMIPAGISKKTGKPYNTFCSNDECPSRKPQPEPTIQTEEYSPFEEETLKVEKLSKREEYNIKQFIVSYVKDAMVELIKKQSEEPLGKITADSIGGDIAKASNQIWVDFIVS